MRIDAVPNLTDEELGDRASTRATYALTHARAVAAAGVKTQFYVDLLFHRAGPAEVACNDLGIGTPFPARDEQRLFTLLVTRADAHA